MEVIIDRFAFEEVPPEAMSGPDVPLRFFAMLRDVLRAPRAFFQGETPVGPSKAIVFGAAVVLPAILVQAAALYGALLYFGLHPRAAQFFLYAPLIAALFVAYLATFYQAASAIASGRRASLSATIRGTCFGFAPMVVAVVPFVGLVVGLVWSFVLHGIALREIHGLNRIQALAVVAFPLVVLASQFAPH